VSLEVSNTGYDLSLDVVDDTEQECLLTLAVNNDIYSTTEANTLLDIYKQLVYEFSMRPEAATTEPHIYNQESVAMALGFGSGQLMYLEPQHLCLILLPGPLLHLHWKGTIERRIEEIASARPNAVAVKFSQGKSVTYSELASISNEIAARLMDSGVTPGTMVATLQEPTAAWIASILAIMKVGSIYVPLDLSMAVVRLRAILHSCQARWILFDNDSKSQFEAIGCPDINTINISVLYAGRQEMRIEPCIPEDYAMVLYTSGSTSTPKGIILRHEGILNLIESVGNVYNLDEMTCALQQSAATFDMCYAQMFMSLGHGGSVVLLPRDLRGDPLAITEIIARQGITFTNATPTEYSSWLRYGNPAFMRNSQWQTAISGGEHVRESLLQQFQQLGLSTLRVFNSYGPTEITWGVTSGELLHGEEAVQRSGVSAGNVLPNYSVYLIDEDLRPVPPGIAGEIYVGGPGVAAGYLKNPILNSERFKRDTFAPQHLRTRGWTMMHRTGDSGRWNWDGTLVIEGRRGTDSQVKLRGFRFDLRDVEHAIIDAAAGFISEAVVSVRCSSVESPEFLVAHVKVDRPVDSENRAQLLRSLPSLLPLPHYMLPLAVLPVDEFPRTTSSKLDRRAVATIPLPDSTYRAQGTDVELTEAQRQLRDIWLSVIPVTPQEPLVPATDFFHVGGTSLLLVQLQADLMKKFRVHVQLTKLMNASMLGSMTLLLEGNWEPEPMDWEVETALSDNIRRQLAGPSFAVPASRRIVVLTGATGLLGSAILDALLADEGVSEVHCIGVRNIDRHTHLAAHEKAFLYNGDIRMASLGLTNEAVSRIFRHANCIIHAVADISHRRAYHSLRAANLESLKQLVAMSLPRQIPLHHVSTSQVGILYSAHTGQDKFPEVSIAHCTPPTDGTDGYTATKWAAERFLERLNVEFNGAWPIYVHRPSLILRPDSPGRSIVHNIAKFSLMLGATPLLENYRGYLNTVDLNTVVSGMMSAIQELETKGDGAQALPATGLQFRHYINEGEPARLDDLNRPGLPIELGGHGSSSIGELAGLGVEKLPAHDWAARAGSLGLAPEIVHWVENAGMTGFRVFPRLVASK
jgi:hybrid polyketide synthase/nonribosomal peptide synthetase ACE1